MNKIAIIQERIEKIICREIDSTNSEIKKLRQKQRDNESYYGIGGPYNRYEKAIARRDRHLEELEALKTAPQKPRYTGVLTLVRLLLPFLQ